MKYIFQPVTLLLSTQSYIRVHHPTGLVRFVSPKSVQPSINKFRKEEIVVQDVAVTVMSLKTEGNGGVALDAGTPSGAASVAQAAN